MRKQYLPFLRTVICPSQFVADVLLDGGVEGPELVVLPNAVHTMPESVRVEGGPFVVAGRLTPEKGVAVALEAARLADVPIVVAGAGPLLDPLAALYPEARFVGLLARDELASLVSASTALVVPSQWFENASMSVLEAMAAGVPIIASRIGGLPEQITDGREGLLVPPGNADALAAAMRSLWVNPALAIVMGERARQTQRKRFAPPEHIAGLVDIYRAAVALS